MTCIHEWRIAGCYRIWIALTCVKCDIMKDNGDDPLNPGLTRVEYEMYTFNETKDYRWPE